MSTSYNIKKRLYGIVLFAMMLSVFVFVSPVKAEIVDSGVCGDNLS